MHRKSFALALLINSVAITLALVIGGWQYESLDDYFMHSVLTGAYGGNYDVHLYFINAIYGYFLWPFYKLLPEMGWFPLFEKIAVLFSFIAITYIILKEHGTKLGGAISLIVVSSVAFDFYLHIEFTKCAAATTAAGIFIFATGDKNKKTPYLFWGSFFMVVGFIFRKEMFLLGIPTLSLFLLSIALLKKSVWKSSIIALGILLVSIFGIKSFDSRLYKGNEYEYYAAYQEPRALFGDGAYYDFDALSDELEERGIGSRDFRYLKAWYFYDNNVFSLDSLNNLAQIAQRNLYQPNYLKIPFAIARCISNTLMNGSVWCWLLLCFSIIFFANNKKWWVPWISLSAIVISYSYLLIVNRVASHVEAGIWLFAVIYALFFMEKKDIPNTTQQKNLIKVLLLMSLMTFACSLTSFEFDIISRKSKVPPSQTTNWAEFLQYTRNHPNDVFLLPFSRYQQLGEFLGKAYKAIPPKSWNNIYSTGYWNIHLPPMNRELQNRGVNNMFKDIKNDNVFVLNDKQSLSFVPFYKEHYHEDLTIDTVEYFGDIFLLKYKSKETTDE